MARRGSLYALCGAGAGALCLLVLLAGARYPEPGRPARARPGPGYQQLLRLAPEEPPGAPEGTAGAGAERALGRARARLQAELAAAGARAAPGGPRRSVIVSSWRSGTTFLGEVLNAGPANFYHYEPLLDYEIVQIRGPPQARRALLRLSQLLRCDYTNMEEYFEYGRTHLHQFNHNTRLWEHCKYERELCFDPDFTARLCKLFPFQSMKVVRLRLRLMEELLEDPELNIKVVLLVRDPRGVLQSRQHRDFCPPAPDCSQPMLLCADMVSDYAAAAHLLNIYPDRLMVLRYEDLALNPNATTHKLLSFLGLDASPGVEEFLRTHTNMEVAGVSSTFRVSKEVPFRWKNILTFDYVSSIQDQCKEAMSHWGYRMAHNASHMTSTDFDPLEEYTVH